MIKRFTAAAMAIMAILPAAAVTLTAEEWNELAHVTYPDPASKVITELSDFRIAARDLKNAVRLVSSAEQPTLTLPDGNIVKGLASDESIWGMDLGRVVIKFGNTYDTAGEYVLTLPANTLSVNESNGDLIGTNPELEVHFNIIGAQEPLVNALETYEFIPASGSTVNSIYRNIGISFPNVTSDMQFSAVMVDGVSMTTPEGDEIGLYDFASVPLEDGGKSNNSTYFFFRSPYTTPGKYKINIKYGTFRIIVKDVTSPTGYTALYNPAMSAEFTVTDQIDPEKLTLEKWVTDPNNKLTVHQLRRITIEFPQSNAPEQGIIATAEVDDSWMNPGGGCGVVPTPGLVSNIMLKNNLFGNAYFCEGATYPKEGNRVTLEFPNITSNGEYTLVIPDDTWRVRNQFPLVYNLPMEIPFVLEYQPGVGVEEVETEADVVAPVYDMMGRTVLDAATEAEVANLPSGLYIHNGKKLIVK